MTVANYPGYLVPNKPMNERGQRATHLLSQDALFTIEEMMSFSLDTYSLLAEEEIQSLLQMDGSLFDDKTKEAFNLIKAWDLKVEKDSSNSFYRGGHTESPELTPDFMTML